MTIEPSLNLWKDRHDKLLLFINGMSCPHFGRQIQWGGTEETEPSPCGICEVCNSKREVKKIVESYDRTNQTKSSR